ncbi:MAG: hypothetical protein ACHQYP_03540 [Nitrospiria bacterium]
MATTKNDGASVRNIWVLIGTLAMAVLMSFLFIKLIVLLDLKDYLGLVVPLLPVFYTIIYPILDRPFLRETQQSVHRGDSLPIEIATPSYFKNLSFWRITGAIVISTGIKFLMEFSHFGMLLFLSDSSLANFWMRLDPVLLLELAKGDLAVSPTPFLFIELMMMSFAGGIWLGYSSKTRPLMEGVVAGTIISILIAFTNLTPLYGKIGKMTTEFTGMSGQGLHLEIFSGVIFFTFIFSCWVLLGIKMKASHQNDRNSKASKKGR